MSVTILKPCTKIVHDDGGMGVVVVTFPVLPTAELREFRSIKLGHYLQQFSKDMLLETNE